MCIGSVFGSKNVIAMKIIGCGLSDGINVKGEITKVWNWIVIDLVSIPIFSQNGLGDIFTVYDEHIFDSTIFILEPFISI